MSREGRLHECEVSSRIIFGSWVVSRNLGSLLSVHISAQICTFIVSMRFSCAQFVDYGIVRAWCLVATFGISPHVMETLLCCLLLSSHLTPSSPPQQLSPPSPPPCATLKPVSPLSSRRLSSTASFLSGCIPTACCTPLSVPSNIPRASRAPTALPPPYSGPRKKAPHRLLAGERARRRGAKVRYIYLFFLRFFAFFSRCMTYQNQKWKGEKKRGCDW